MTSRRAPSVRRLSDVTRLTIEVDDKVAQRMAEAAAKRGVAPEQLAGEAVAEKFAGHKLAFAAIGASGSTKGAAEADELLAEGFGR
jgi:predicted transcriptional regulator